MFLPFPVITNEDLSKIIGINDDGDLPGFAAIKVRGTYEVAGGAPALEARLEEIFAEIDTEIAAGARIIVLSDRGANDKLAPIPSLLLTSAVHHHLIRSRARTRIGLVVECRRRARGAPRRPPCSSGTAPPRSTPTSSSSPRPT